MVRLLLLVLCCCNSAGQALTLNEIMFDPAGSEGSDEFIELYNNSQYPVNLTGWRVTDGADTDLVVATEQGLQANPYQYVIVLDPDYLAGESSTYDGMIPEAALVLTIDNSTFGSRGLSNSGAETISLISPQGLAVSSYRYTIGNTAGHSDEKRLPGGGDSSANWMDSESLNGTPGAVNSVTPPEIDLAVQRFVSDPTTVLPGSAFRLRVQVLNLGTSAADNTLILAERIGFDTTAVVSWPVTGLPPGDSIELVSDELVLGQSSRKFTASLGASDERNENNARAILVGSQSGNRQAVFNEIMYSPASGRSEWIEILNTSGTELGVSGWRFGDGSAIGDSNEQVVLPDLRISPDSFLVLASDSSIFLESVPNFAAIFVWSTPSPSLNNSGDSLVLYDGEQALVDRADYRPSWGGESGKSVERIDAAAESEDSHNWATSLDSTGSTPGRANSRAAGQAAPGTQILELTPNPFSPDGDGRNDELRITYVLDYPDSRIDVKIYDTRGREVRELANNSPASNHGMIIWDGRDGDSAPVPTGAYIVYLEALGNGQTRVQTAKRVVVLVRKA
ncbi:lamin tail domain-containing protein [candidate division KSB1 bacterium]|nr:lamin tail domain-containing protein [candidate division KSB1 bacterium]